MRITCSREGGFTRLEVEGPMLIPDFDRAAVTAVVRSRAGQCGYWALSHPRETPDFHDSAGFVLSPADFGC